MAMLAEIRRGVQDLQPLLDLLKVGSLGQGESVVARAYNLLLGLQEQLQRSEARWDRDAARDDRLLTLIGTVQADLAATSARVEAMHAMLTMPIGEPADQEETASEEASREA